MSQRRYEYKIKISGSASLQRMLNEEGEQGWRVAAIEFQSSIEQLDGAKQSIILFEREKP